MDDRQSVMKSIMIAGYYGAGNLGDEAILSAILEPITDEQESVEVTVCSWQPELTQKIHGVSAISWLKMSQIALAASKADLIIIGGGGIFQDYWGLNPNSYLRSNHGGITTYGSLALLAELFGIPCLLFGVGIGPLTTERGKKHTLKTIMRCQAVSLRDQQSYEELVAIGYNPDDPLSPPISVATDLTFLTHAAPASSKSVDDIFTQLSFEPQARLLGVNLRYWDRSAPLSDWLPIAAAGIREFLDLKSDYDVILLPFQRFTESIYTDDEKVCKELAILIDVPERVHVVPGVIDPYLMKALIGRCDIFFGMRLHAVIFALLNQVPTAALSYDPKIDNLMCETGLDSVLPIYNLEDPAQIRSLLIDLDLNQNQIRPRIAAYIREQQNKSTKQLDLLGEMLENAAVKPIPLILRKFLLNKVQVMEDLDLKLNDLQESSDVPDSEINELHTELNLLSQEIQNFHSRRIYHLIVTLQNHLDRILPSGKYRRSEPQIRVSGSRVGEKYD